MRRAAHGEGDADGRRLFPLEDLLRRLGDERVAEDVDAVTPHILRLQGEEVARLAVRVHDGAVLVEEEDAVVHGFEDEVELLILRLRLVDLVREVAGELVDGTDEDIELVIRAIRDAPREVTAHDGVGRLDDGEDGGKLAMREPEGEGDGDEERRAQGDEQHADAVGEGVLDRLQRGRRPNDPGEPLVDADGDGDVHHVFLQGVAVAGGGAVVVEYGSLHLGAAPVVVHRLGVLVRIGEHRASFVEDGHAQSRRRVDLGDVVIQPIPMTIHVVSERLLDDLRVHAEVPFLIPQILFMEEIHEQDAEDEQAREGKQ